MSIAVAAKAQKVACGTDAAPPLDGQTGWHYNTDTCRIFLNTPLGAE